ncbi:MAG: hypothetical protein KA369_20705 [Spirochaetes bacterium]|nr:hypothetical protein [Spirochaetota bacterium]
MSLKKHARTLSLCLLVVAGTAGCDMSYDKTEDKTTPVLGVGLGCLTSSPITMRSTTYDMDKNIIGASEQIIANMSAQNTQPSMKSMYEMYAGVELEFELSIAMISDIIKSIISGSSDSSALMAYVKQTPLLTQFWALNKMSSSVSAGTDGIWMNSDDTIDPLYGYFETTKLEDRYRQLMYSDFGVTPSVMIDYIIENNRKTKTYHYAAGADGKFGTDDDVLAKTVLYRYDSGGKMVRAINYSDDESAFVSSYVFTYDTKGRIASMTSYSDPEETKRLVWGSYSTCTWDDSGATPLLDITLGLRMPGLVGSYNMSLIKFHYEFNEDGTIHKMIQYEPMTTAIDTCYVYVYSKDSLLGMGFMNDESLNYSDDEATRVSHTVNKLTFN